MVSTITTSIRRMMGWAIGEAKAVGQRAEDRAAVAVAMRHLHERHGDDHGEEAERVAPQRRADAADGDRDRRKRRADDPAEVPLRIRQADAGDEVLASTRSGRIDWNEGNVNAPMQPATKLSIAMPERRRAFRRRPTLRGSRRRRPTVRCRRSAAAACSIDPPSPNRSGRGRRWAGTRPRRRSPTTTPSRGVGDVVAQPDCFHPRADVREQCTGPHQAEVSRSKWCEGRRGHAGATLPVSLYSAWRPGGRCSPAFRIAQSGNACPQNWHQPSPKTARCRCSPCPQRFVNGVHAFGSPSAARPRQR